MEMRKCHDHRTVSFELVVAFKCLRFCEFLPTLAERLTLAEKQNAPLDDLLLMLLYRGDLWDPKLSGRGLSL
jgi:hypothetical protein